MNACRACRDLKPIEQYNILIQRHDDLIAMAKAEFSEAFRNRDQKGMDKMKAIIDETEEAKRTLFKPAT